MSINRRRFLSQGLMKSGLIGCSLAASPLVTPVSFASAPWDHRLVVIILRGGMDGLDVVQPRGDQDFQTLRAGLLRGNGGTGGAGGKAIDLNGFYAMHPGLAPLLPLWRRGHLGFVHAVSTPYRDKRSHFDGQDLLEAGTLNLGGVRDGWLNRLLQRVPGVEGETAFALGQSRMKLLSGEAPVSDWEPKAAFEISPQAERLAELLMEGDPLFESAYNEALTLSQDTLDPFKGADAPEGQSMMGGGTRRRGTVALAAYAADRLREDTRIAAFSINGWDTHARQSQVLGKGLAELSDVILTLQNRLGRAVWDKTAIVAMTEFGRTARENGTKGTDHGTGGAMILAGGAVRGGKVYGKWPGLSEADLYDRRDLMPTGDVRAAAAWVLRGLTPIGRTDLEAAVFPGLDMGSDPGLLA